MKIKYSVSILTGGKDPHYALGLLSSLIDKNIKIDFIGNDMMMNAEIVKRENVSYFNLRGDQRDDASLKEKIFRIFRYYLKLIMYASKSKSEIFHILWLNKFLFFDRTFLNLFYKILGKKLIFTAHNVNAGERDGTDGILNRISLMFMYSIVDHIFVHTDKMKEQLIKSFYVKRSKISVISFGVNNIIPKSSLSRKEARIKIGLDDDAKIILFFGNIAPYKGLEYLISAVHLLKEKIDGLKLIIAGRVKDDWGYWTEIMGLIERDGLKENIIERIGYVPDQDVEIYIKSADVIVLPYKYIFQSGVLFLSYNFGVPVIAANVGSIKENIVEGVTGYLFDSENSIDLADKILKYFESDLYKYIENRRDIIIKYANEKGSWEKIGANIMLQYKKLIDYKYYT